MKYLFIGFVFMSGCATVTSTSYYQGCVDAMYSRYGGSFDVEAYCDHVSRQYEDGFKDR